MMSRMGRPRHLAGAVAAVAFALLLAGCGGASGGGSDGTTDGGGDLWLIDDPDLNAVVLEGAVEGFTVVGFTCDLASGFTAVSPGEAQYPRASVTATLGMSSISYDEEGIAANAEGVLELPATVPPTLEVAADRGLWGINAGEGEVTDWVPSVTLTVTEVPVGVDACSAAHVFGEGLIRDGGTAAEVIAAFLETGLRDVSAECPDEFFTWTPPDMTCEEFAPLAW